MGNSNRRNKRNSNTDREGKRSNNKPGRNDRAPVGKEGAVVPPKVGEDMNNDPNWYFTNPEVANQASQLSFQSFLGVPGTIDNYTVPTIMTIHLNPSPGNTFPGAPWAQNNRSGFNMSMTKLYNRLSMKSGRNMAYAPQDVGMAILGIGELLSMVSYIRRMFGIVKWWNVRNRMVPKSIIKAMGIDPDDFFAHFSDYRMRANTLIMACNQIPILTNSGYLRKCASLYDNVYKDCDTGMCQYYIYVPNTTWILDETSDPKGTVAKTVGVVLSHETAVPTVITFDTFLTTIFEPMVSALLTSSTLNLVYADIYNLNKTEDLQLATIDIISEEYAIVPIHDPLVLKQIHNMTILNWSEIAASDNYTHWNDVVCDPDTNSIKYSPIFEVGNETQSFPAHPDLPMVIDTDTSDPDLAEKIEITRYMCPFSNDVITVGSRKFWLYMPVPDHYCAGCMIYTDDIDASKAEWIETLYLNGITAAEINTVKKLDRLSQFDWAPVLYVLQSNASTAKVNYVFADLNSFTLVDCKYIRRLNSIMYMDLFEFR